MTQQAYKFLVDRLRGICHACTDRDPASIRQARTRIAVYDKQAYAKKSARRKLVEQARLRVKEIIFAGDYEKAVQAIRQFEARDFAGRKKSLRHARAMVRTA